MPKPAPYVFDSPLVFLSVAVTNCLQNYNIFPKHKAFLKNILKK